MGLATEAHASIPVRLISVRSQPNQTYEVMLRSKSFGKLNNLELVLMQSTSHLANWSNGVQRDEGAVVHSERFSLDGKKERTLKLKWDKPKVSGAKTLVVQLRWHQSSGSFLSKNLPVKYEQARAYVCQAESRSSREVAIGAIRFPSKEEVSFDLANRSRDEVKLTFEVQQRGPNGEWLPAGARAQHSGPLKSRQRSSHTVKFKRASFATELRVYAKLTGESGRAATRVACFEGTERSVKLKPVVTKRRRRRR